MTMTIGVEGPPKLENFLGSSPSVLINNGVGVGLDVSTTPSDEQLLLPAAARKTVESSFGQRTSVFRGVTK